MPRAILDKLNTPETILANDLNEDARREMFPGSGRRMAAPGAGS